MYSKQGVYSNKDPLESEVIALPAVPQPPPFKNVLLSWSLKSLFLSDRFENIVCSIRKLKLNFWLKIDWKDVKLFSINTPSYFQARTKAERSFDWAQCFKALKLVHSNLSIKPSKQAISVLIQVTIILVRKYQQLSNVSYRGLAFRRCTIGRYYHKPKVHQI